MEHPIKMDDLGVPLFLETAIWWLVKPTHLEKYAQVKFDHSARVLGVKIPKNLWNHHLLLMEEIR